jgi:hypothetical protein
MLIHSVEALIVPERGCWCFSALQLRPTPCEWSVVVGALATYNHGYFMRVESSLDAGYSLSQSSENTGHA